MTLIRVQAGSDEPCGDRERSADRGTICPEYGYMGVWSQVVPQGLPAVQSGWREAIVPNLSGDGGRAEPQIRSARAAITAFFQWFSDNGETLALGRCYLP